MKKILLVLLCTPFVLFSQLPYQTELGIGGGVMTYQGDLEPRQVNAGFYERGPAFMVGLRRNLHNLAACRLQVAGGVLHGTDNRFSTTDDRHQRGFSFSSPLIEGSLQLEVYPFGLLRTEGRVRMEDGSRSPRRITNRRRLVAPFATVGIGAVYTHTKPDFNLNSDGLNPTTSKPRIDSDVEVQKSRVAVSLPLGGGFRFRLSNCITFDLEAYTRLVASDYLDGISLAGNPEQNDWFFTGMAAFNYAFGSGQVRRQTHATPHIADSEDASKSEAKTTKKEKKKPQKADKTEVSDTADAEKPAKKGKQKKGKKEKSTDSAGSTRSAKKSGADRDSDGVADDADECPDDKGPRVLRGCPDRDKDGVADAKDNCPDTPGKLSLAGCPDSDSDGVADKDDACPNLAGVAAYRGCPAVDRDKDGVADAEDLCPDMPGDIKWNGCADNDGDNIPDHKDDCPGIAGSEKTKGCPDSDDDGVADKDDACPTIQGTIAKKGCPEKNTAPGVAVPYKAIYFNSQKKDWYETSYATLEEVIQMMKENPILFLRIEGNTDNSGDGPANTLLSEQRAKQCYDYLISKGIPAKRMTYMGFADRRPVATNSTREGRQLNRRVEIHFYQ